MAVTQNTYTGNGSTTNYSFTFPYLETTDIKVSLNGLSTTAYTLANATTIQFNTAPANGAAIRIYRETDDSALAATFYPGSAIRSNDLNENFTQNLYVTQESSNNAAAATSTANTALTNSNTAISTANSAVSTANTASTNASAAVSTANTASSNASAAVSTANTASTNATAAVNTANSAAADAATALSTANTALSTASSASTAASAAVTTANASASAASGAVNVANTASTNAYAAVSTANTASSNATTALSTANTAISTANAAASAVANAVLYDTVANVAAIPGSPANNDAVEVIDSTGIESFTPLSGIPVGFVGDSGLSVRMVYTTIGATWNWIQYFPNDPEARYGDAITTLQTDLNTAEADILALDSAKLDSTTAASTYLTQANAASTYQTQAGMSSYLTTANAGSTYLTQANATSTYLTQANASSTYAPINNAALTGLTLINELGIANWARFSDADASHYVSLQAPAVVTSNVTLTLPATAGSAGQALSTNGSGQLGWETVLKPSDIGTTVQSYDADTVKTDSNQTFTVAQRGAISAIGNTSGTITLDFATANHFSFTLNANSSNTLANPSNLTAGQSGCIYITQDSSGSRLISFGTNWDFAGGTVPSLSTAANAVDVLCYAVRSNSSIAATLIKDVK